MSTLFYRYAGVGPVPVRNQQGRIGKSDAFGHSGRGRAQVPPLHVVYNRTTTCLFVRNQRGRIGYAVINK